MREVALEAVKVDENVAMWTIICRTTVQSLILNSQQNIEWVLTRTGSLQRLRRLDLSANRIQTLGSTVFQANSQLQSLHIRSNNFRQVGNVAPCYNCFWTWLMPLKQKVCFAHFLGTGISSEHRWFSGRMLACHAGGPGSIPGRCKSFFTSFTLSYI